MSNPITVEYVSHDEFAAKVATQCYCCLGCDETQHAARRMGRVNTHLSPPSQSVTGVALEHTLALPDDAEDALRAKRLAVDTIDADQGALDEVGLFIHAHPELNYNERAAHDRLCAFLESRDFRVERGYLGVPTAFRAETGSVDDGPTVAVCLEYDALPGIGHACGHNLIAEAGLAAGVGVQAVLASDEHLHGKVVLLGTPAEEGGGGKIQLMKRGAFRDIDLAMMVHPAPATIAYTQSLAIDSIRVCFRGKSAHAAAFPDDGVNALDAIVMGFNGISAMRQQMKPTWRVHGIIRKAGEKPNIIPDYSEGHFYIRAPTNAELEELRVKVQGCFEGAARMTGCTVEVTQLIENDDTDGEDQSELFYSCYENLRSNSVMVEAYKRNAASSLIGKTFMSKEEDMQTLVGSTDMGNVSHVVPSIHPSFAIATNRGEGNHHAGFTAKAGTKGALKEARDAGAAMCCTIIDLLRSPEMVERAKLEFQEAGECR